LFSGDKVNGFFYSNEINTPLLAPMARKIPQQGPNPDFIHYICPLFILYIEYYESNETYIPYPCRRIGGDYRLSAQSV
jgi:hypothetical protein